MSEDDKLPGLTVGKLRAALEDIDDDMPVVINSEVFTGGIVSASLQEFCGGEAFGIECSDDPEDFEVGDS